MALSELALAAVWLCLAGNRSGSKAELSGLPCLSPRCASHDFSQPKVHYIIRSNLRITSHTIESFKIRYECYSEVAGPDIIIPIRRFVRSEQHLNPHHTRNQHL